MMTVKKKNRNGAQEKKQQCLKFWLQCAAIFFFLLSRDAIGIRLHTLRGLFVNVTTTEVTKLWVDKLCVQQYTVKLQIFVRYPFLYFWLETGSCELIFVLSTASKQITLKFDGLQTKNKLSSCIIFCTFSQVRKYEIKYRTKICDFTVTLSVLMWSHSIDCITMLLRKLLFSKGANVVISTVKGTMSHHNGTAREKFITLKFYLLQNHYFGRECSLACYLPKV